MQDKVKLILLSMVNKRYLYLFSSFDEAIRQVGNLFKYKTFLIPDKCYQPSYRVVNSYNELKTKYGIIEMKDLITKCQNKILLANGLTSCLAEQPIDLFLDICKEKNCIIINDVSGSIHLNSARLGDYAIGSFDEESIINLGYGAFFASNAELNIIENFDKANINELYGKIMEIDARVKYLTWINGKVKTDLRSFNVIHKDRKGINVLINFDSLIEKRKIINYCEKNQLPYTSSPKYLKSDPNLLTIDINKK